MELAVQISIDAGDLGRWKSGGININVLSFENTAGVGRDIDLERWLGLDLIQENLWRASSSVGSDIYSSVTVKIREKQRTKKSAW